MSESSIQIQLNDIIQINSPENPVFHNKIFIVIYASESKIKIIDSPVNLLETKEDSFQEFNLPIEDGNLLDPTIESIELLSRDDNPGFAMQNNLTPNTWIDITFSEEIPSIITGEITNLEEDMIEIKIYPSNKVIYIDFKYQGIPDDLPIKSILIREKPKETILDTTSRAELEVSQQEGVNLDEEEEKAKGEDDKSEEGDESDEIEPEESTIVLVELDQVILEGDAIQFGEELGEIYQEVTVDEANKRYSIDSQTNDLMDDMISRIPTRERRPEVLNYLHLQINRFIELRKEFSKFDENGNANMPNYKGVNNKPLITELKDFKKKIPWLIPVAKNKRKIYHGETNETSITGEKIYAPLMDEEYNEMDIQNKLISDENLNENNYLKQYRNDKQNTFNYNEQRYKTLVKRVTSLYTPFNKTENNHDIIYEAEVQSLLNVLINNQEDYDSFAVKDMNIKKTKFLMQNYVPSIDLIRMDALNNTYKVSISNKDTLQLLSFMMLPKNVMKYSKAFLHESNILEKMELNSNPFYYYKLLNKHTAPNTIDINSFENKKNYDKVKFLSTITEFTLDSSIQDEDKYDKFLNTIVPKIKDLFLYTKNFIDGYSVRAIIKEMEPFHVYGEDITYRQYEEFRTFLKLQIIEYKKNFVQKSKDFKKIHPRNDKQEVHPLPLAVSNIKHPLNDKLMDSYVYEELYNVTTNKDSTAEIIKKLMIDSFQMASNSNTYGNLELFGIIDIETEIKSLENQFLEEKKEEEAKDDCGVFVLGKKYEDYDALLEDNDRDIYFDKSYDTTIYDIIDNYKEQQQTMDKDQFNIFLIEELKKNIGLSAEKARDDAEAMILGKRPVKEGNYAMLINRGDSEDENDQSFFRRVNNKWERDEAMKGIYADNQKIFCNMKSTCFQINNVCSSNETAENELKQNAIKYILNEFDKRLELGIDEITDKIKRNIQENERMLKAKIQIEKFHLLKHNNFKFMLGGNVEDIQVKQSPYEKLKNLILGHNNFSEKQNYILIFCNKFTRENIHGENNYWLYCKDSNIKLLPIFLHKLAVAYFDGTYDSKIEEICKNQGEISDDESYWVDRHSGYYIKNISYSTDMGYDESGYAIKTSDILEDEKEILLDGPKQDIDPINISIDNIINAISSNTRIFIEGYRDFIKKHVSALLPKIINETIYEKLKVLAEKKNKKIQSYELSVNKSLMILTLSFIHISIQISIPPVLTRNSFPGCVKSFSGYPLDGDSDYGGIEYIACVASKMKSSSSPWNGINKMKEAVITREIKNSIEKYIINLPTVISKLEEKTEYLSKPENQEIPVSVNFKKWINFLPPLQSVQIPRVDNISNAFIQSFKENMKKGSEKQHEQYLTLYSKAKMLTMEIIKFIQNIINSKSPVLTNNLLEPFLENACCNDGLVQAYNYFINENKSIHDNNTQILFIENILYDYNNFYTAPMMLDLTNTKIPIVNTSEYTEELIYKTFIHYGNLNNEDPIPKELEIFFSEKPEEMKDYKNLKEQIEFLKENGKNFTYESFMDLLKLLSNNIPPEYSIKTTHYQRLDDLLNFIIDNERNIPPPFTNGLLNLLKNPENKMTENDNELQMFKEYLYKSSTELMESIRLFLTRYSSTTKKKVNETVDFLMNLNIWKPLNEMIPNNDHDYSRIFTFMHDFVDKFFIVFPQMIKTNNKNTNISIPNHWNMTYSGKKSIESLIEMYYSKLNKYMNNETIISLFQSFPDEIELYIKILGEIQFKLGNFIETGSDVIYEFKTFDKNLCVLIHKYVITSLIYEMTNIPDVEKFEFKLGRKELVETTTSVSLESDSLKLEEMDFEEDVPNTNKELIANYIIDSCSIFSITKKKVLNFSLQDIKKKVNVEKEKEKRYEFTDKLANMDNEERELNNLFKTSNLGDWGKGKEKGITQYQKDFFDAEVKDREKRIMIERNLANNPNVTEMNINIFALEYEEDQAAEEQIEHDAFNMEDIPDDDDAGENDYFEYDGGK